jgi:hypothetical protein
MFLPTLSRAGDLWHFRCPFCRHLFSTARTRIPGVMDRRKPDRYVSDAGGVSDAGVCPVPGRADDRVGTR